MGGWLNFLKIYPYQPRTKVMVRSNVWCLLIKSSNFTFDEDAALLPEIACLDDSVAGFPEYLDISAPTLDVVGFNAFFVSTYQSKQICF